MKLFHFDRFLWSYAVKDLFKQRTRFFLGVGGVTISLLLLSSILFVTDSVSYNFINFLTIDSGNQDLVLRVRHYYGEPANRSSYFDYDPIVSQIKQNIPEIEYFIPRTTFGASINGLGAQDENVTRNVQVMALNLTLENALNFGHFTWPISPYNIQNGIPVNSCLVWNNFASQLNIQENQTISVYINRLRTTVQLTVFRLYDHILKFPVDEEPDLIVAAEWWGSLANDINADSRLQVDWTHFTNNLIMLLGDTQNIYDVRDVAGTENQIAEIGARILVTLGIEAWTLDYPKLELLFLSEFLSSAMNILFVVIAINMILIVSILIQGILSTSIEERIREFGINRVLGARKTHNLKLVLIQATIICIAGTTLGFLLGLLLVSQVLIPVIETKIPIEYLGNGIAFVVNPISFLFIYAIGIGVSLIVSISPAIKVLRMKIVQSINPYRTTEEVYHLRKEGSANTILIVSGLLLSANALIVFYLLPRIILSLDFALFIDVLIGSLIAFLIGTSLMAIGFMPFLIRLFIFLLEPFYRKIMNIVKITIHRYQRRNLNTTIMFVLSFSFILFATTMIETQKLQIGSLIEYHMGSDLLLRPESYDLSAPSVRIQARLMEIEGIERASSVIASANDLEQIYAEEGKEFSVELGDYINYQSNDVRVWGIDSYYLDSLTQTNQQYVVLSQGEKNEAFIHLFNSSEINIIISSNLAGDLQLRLNDPARLTFTRGTEEKPYIATIVGIATSMPGMGGTFRKSGLGGGGGGDGVLISAENYVKCMNIPGVNDAYIDKVFIKVRNGWNPVQVEDQIHTFFASEYDLDIIQMSEGILESENTFITVKYLLLAIEIGAVVIAIFGLMTSAYSSILERKREIGIIRCLGLYGHEVQQMFGVESAILMLSSATSGSLIGIIMSLGLTENMTLFTASPRMVSIPWDIVVIIYSVSILALIIGIRLLMHRLRNKNILEIFRETL